MSSKYSREPWLNPRFWDRFGPLPAGVDAPAPPCAEVVVLDRRLERVAVKRAYGLLAYCHEPRLIRVDVDFDVLLGGFDDWCRALLRPVTWAEDAMWRKGYYLTPTNASWHRRDGANLSVGVLFTKEYTNREKAPHVGRLGSLMGKLTGGSRLLMRDAVIDGGDPARSYYKDWDGVYFVREGALTWTPPSGSRIFQIYGIPRPETYLSRASAGQVDPIVWGLALVVPDQFWSDIVQGCGLSSSPAQVIAASRDFVKFGKNATFPAGGYEIYCARESFVAHRSKVSQEDRQLHQLDERAVEVLAARRREKAIEIRVAFEALAEGNRMPLVRLLDQQIEELYEGSRRADVALLMEDDPEDVDVLFQVLQSTCSALYAGAPVHGDKLADAYTGLVRHRVKSVAMPGVTAYSFPGNLAGKRGLYLPLECSGKVKPGYGVTDIRFPNTGTSMVPCFVRGFCPLPVVIGDPITGKTLQNEDYDGDISTVVFRTLVHNEGWLPPVPKVPEIGDLNPFSQILFSSYSKLAMGVTDSLITNAMGANICIHALGGERFRLQTTVDMAKKCVDTKSVESPISLGAFSEAAEPAYFVVRKAHRGIKGVNRITNLVTSALRRDMPHRLVSAALALPLIEITEGKREVDVAKLSKEKIFAGLHAHLDGLNGALWLIHAYNAWLYLVGLGKDYEPEGYDLLRQAKQVIATEPTKWARALNCLAYAVLAYTKASSECLALLNKHSSRPVVPFSIGRRNAVYKAAFDAWRIQGGKLYSYVKEHSMIRSFAVVTAWTPLIPSHYDLKQILEDLGYVHKYPVKLLTPDEVVVRIEKQKQRQQKLKKK